MATRKKGMIDWLYLGNRIADMRRSRKMTQQELAEYIGRSEVYIGYMEQGKRHGTWYMMSFNMRKKRIFSRSSRKT